MHAIIGNLFSISRRHNRYFTLLFWLRQENACVAVSSYNVEMANSKPVHLHSILKTSPLNNVERRDRNVFKGVRFRARATEIDVAEILKDYLDGTNESRYKQLLELRNDSKCSRLFLAGRAAPAHQIHCSAWTKGGALCRCSAKRVLDQQDTKIQKRVPGFHPVSGHSAHILLQVGG